MNFFKFLLRMDRRVLFLTAFAALLSGACNAGLIALINIGVNQAPNISLAAALGFLALGLGKLGSNIFSQLMLARFSQRAVARLRNELVRRILDVPLRRLEDLGPGRVMVGLTEDIFNISYALLRVPAFGVNLAVLLGGAVYLGYLSWQLLTAITGCILIGSIPYRSLVIRGFRQIQQARREEDKLFGHFRALTDGIKELKLHRNRRAGFLFEWIQPATDAYQNHNIRGETRFITAHAWGHLLFFILIGLILFALPHAGNISREALTGYVITILYLMGPLAGVMSAFAVFGRAKVALNKVEELANSLSAETNETCSIAPSEQDDDFERLELRGVTHAYRHENDERPFTLGPIDLAFRPGEIVFLVGGNGSGKSTLAKIITGLYPPQDGQILLNGNPVRDGNRDDYRQMFSAVFSDFYLFEGLLGLEQENLDDMARGYLKRLHLDQKVKIRNGRFSTVDLSQGQRKRLALLTAYLEDRPVYVFDEWAADQDPQFKEVFYKLLLPELKAAGKTALVITHDDHYFNEADRIIKLDYGKIESVEPARHRRAFQSPFEKVEL